MRHRNRGLAGKLVGPVLAVLLLASCTSGGAEDGSDDRGDSGDTSTTTTTVTTTTDTATDELLIRGMTVDELREAGHVVVAPGESVRLGVAVALTGPFPDLGQDILNAALLAVEDLNDDGGVSGFAVEVVQEDSACDDAGGARAAEALTAGPGVVAVAGATCSAATLAMIPTLESAMVPFVSPSAADPAVITSGCSVCNRVALSETLQGQVAAEFVVSQLGISSVAIIDDGSAYGTGLAATFAEQLGELGGSVTTEVSLQPGDNDFRELLADVSASSPALLFFGGYATEAGLLARQKADVGLGEAVLFAGDGALTEQYLAVAGSAADGTYASTVVQTEVASLNQEFDARYRERFGVSPDSLGRFHAESYDSILVIADAIRRVAEVEEGHLVMARSDVLAAIRGTAGLQGLTGTISCDENGECAAGGVQVYTVAGGEFQQVFGVESTD